MGAKYPAVRPFNDDEWLERFTRRARQVGREHICGRCRTPWGRSALPCPNETR